MIPHLCLKLMAMNIYIPIEGIKEDGKMDLLFLILKCLKQEEIFSIKIITTSRSLLKYHCQLLKYYCKNHEQQTTI